MTNYQTTIKTNIFGYVDGIYTSNVFGWLSNGKLSNVSTLTFINYLCGDVNNDGSLNVLDLDFMVARLFRGGPPPAHPASGDIDCDGISCSIIDLNYLVNYFYRNGAD